MTKMSGPSTPAQVEASAEASAGPGQNPARPQPTPKTALPSTRRRSMSVLAGNRIGAPNRARPGAAEHQAAVDVGAGREADRRTEQGAPAFFCQPEAGGRYQHGAAHGEQERRVPGARQVEEAEHLAGVGETREDQAEAEHQADQEEGDELHGRLQVKIQARTWRTSQTVTKPTATKVQVATIERGDMRAMPHTPWPLVQPAP